MNFVKVRIPSAEGGAHHLGFPGVSPVERLPLYRPDPVHPPHTCCSSQVYYQNHRLAVKAGSGWVQRPGGIFLFWQAQPCWWHPLPGVFR